MHHYTYLITNLINNKIYYGVRSCECDPEQDTKYMGSGNLIKRAIKKYGIENFKKEVDGIFESRENANLYEAQVVDKDFIEREDTYNLKTGGISGYGFKLTDEQKNKLSKSHRGKVLSEETKRRISNSVSGRKNYFYGRTLTIEHKQKIAETSKGRIHSDYAIRQFSKEWLVTSPEGVEYKIINLAKFCREHGLDRGTMSAVGRGERKQYRGWYCKLLQNS